MPAETDCRDDPFAHSGDDRVFSRTTDEPFQIGTNRDSRSNAKLDTVFGDSAQSCLVRLFGVGAVDHFGINARLNRIQHVTSRKVDCRSSVEVEVDVRPVRGDNGPYDVGHISPRQVVGFKSFGRDAGFSFASDPCLHTHDLRLNDRPGVDLTKSHSDKAPKPDVGSG